MEVPKGHGDNLEITNFIPEAGLHFIEVLNPKGLISVINIANIVWIHPNPEEEATESMIWHSLSIVSGPITIAEEYQSLVARLYVKVPRAN